MEEARRYFLHFLGGDVIPPRSGLELFGQTDKIANSLAKKWVFTRICGLL
jgi:hypothetical protein